MGFLQHCGLILVCCSPETARLIPADDAVHVFIGFVLWELFPFQFFWILAFPFSLEVDG